MPEKVVPMIHVPDVRGTADWHSSIGFKVIQQGEIDGQVVSAELSFGSTNVMLDSDGKPSDAHRRKVDLYVFVENVDDVCHRLRNRVEMVEDLHDTVYGMREFIIRDINRFWITFGQSIQI